VRLENRLKRFEFQLQLTFCWRKKSQLKLELKTKDAQKKRQLKLQLRDVVLAARALVYARRLRRRLTVKSKQIERVNFQIDAAPIAF